MTEEKNDTTSGSPEGTPSQDSPTQGTPDAGSASSPAPTPPPTSPQPAPAKAARNPVERFIVWGVIIALLVVVYLEFRANTAFQSSVQNMQKELERADNNPGQPFLESAIESHLAGDPARTGPDEKTTTNFGVHRESTYTWKSLLREQKLYVVTSFEDIQRFEDQLSHVIAIETEQDRTARLEAEEAANAPPVVSGDAASDESAADDATN